MPYERLHAWKACDELTVAVYKATERFPRHELYGLTSQARRAAFSSAANIAEGSAKRGPREFRRNSRGPRFADPSAMFAAELKAALRACDVSPYNSWRGKRSVAL